MKKQKNPIKVCSYCGLSENDNTSIYRQEERITSFVKTDLGWKHAYCDKDHDLRSVLRQDLKEWVRSSRKDVKKGKKTKIIIPHLPQCKLSDELPFIDDLLDLDDDGAPDLFERW